MRGVDYVFHLAAMISVPESMSKPVECNEINTVGTLLILEEAARAGVKKLVLSSSAAIGMQSPRAEAAAAGLTLAQVLRAGMPQYTREHRLPLQHGKVIFIADLVWRPFEMSSQPINGADVVFFGVKGDPAQVEFVDEFLL